MRDGKRSLAVAVAVALLGTGLGAAVAAQSPAPVLPSGCKDGEVVVSRGQGGFACADLRELLGLRRCSKDDFLAVDAFGRIECVTPSDVGRGSRALLPRCSRGETLVSEGLGGWSCARPP
ncbi:MAG TPA: hypothetical protein VLS93_14180 [Anaeromyxobacteraceae bacterium]|nr:hypothetical protein [Anaeromyxobacteraceae bacterium]